MKILKSACLGVLAFSLSACVSNLSELPVAENLPPVNGIKVLAGSTQVGFEWEPIFDLNVDGYKIFRAKMGDEVAQQELIGEIKDRYATHFSDQNLQPESKYLYNIVTYNKSGVSASTSVSVATLNRPAAVPFVQAIAGLPNKIKIIWRPHPDQRVVKYRVYKQAANSDKWSVAATVNGRLSAEYIDNIRPNEYAKYKIAAITFAGTESELSQIAQGVSKTLPPSVSGLMASGNLPKKIMLSWDAPQYEDFDHFKIYVAKSKLLPFVLLGTSKTTSFEDQGLADGEVREYYVSMVDKDGLESPRPKIAAKGMSLAKPRAPQPTGCKVLPDGSAQLTWYAQDERTKSYAIFKNGEQIATSAQGMFVDKNHQGGDRYYIVAIDEYGVSSDPSASLRAGK